ncbi:hypothetical protein DPEC_G00245770 [Dallia pectoralis]|uniref:Uncharacterized protein n=1 Tax=Dallia pectoralis TaxID=75939 RepID=A0ACC2FW75_DALPE|nr:hypothetical protein DPEC_G00245770 [Dallia pectoralis]
MVPLGPVLTPRFLGPGQGVCPWRSRQEDGERGQRGGAETGSKTTAAAAFLSSPILFTSLQSWMEWDRWYGDRDLPTKRRSSPSERNGEGRRRADKKPGAQIATATEKDQEDKINDLEKRWATERRNACPGLSLGTERCCDCL